MHSTAVWVGRAKQAKVGVGGETARVFIFLAASPLVRAHLRLRHSVVARQNCHATQATDISRRHQRFPRGTGNK